MRTVFTHSLVSIRNLTRSLRRLVRFSMLDQLVCKYRTHTLSMKYSICTVLRGTVRYGTVQDGAGQDGTGRDSTGLDWTGPYRTILFM